MMALLEAALTAIGAVTWGAGITVFVRRRRQRRRVASLVHIAKLEFELGLSATAAVFPMPGGLPAAGHRMPTIGDIGLRIEPPPRKKEIFKVPVLDKQYFIDKHAPEIYSIAYGRPWSLTHSASSSPYPPSHMPPLGEIRWTA